MYILIELRWECMGEVSVGVLTCFSALQKKEDAKVAEERQQAKWQKEHMYDDLHTEESLQQSNNQDRDPDWEDDFM